MDPEIEDVTSAELLLLIGQRIQLIAPEMVRGKHPLTAVEEMIRWLQTDGKLLLKRAEANVLDGE